MNKLMRFLYREISGKKFKELLGSDYPYLIKYMNNDDKHHGMVYSTGLNIDIEPFTPRTSCSKGGIYFCHISDFGTWYDWNGDFIRLVEIEDNARVYVEQNKIKADRVVLSEKEHKNILLKRLIMNIYKVESDTVLAIIRKYGFTVRFIEQKDITEEMMIDAVKQNGNIIKHVEQKFRTIRMMLEAVKQNGSSIKYIEQSYRTYKIMLEAVRQDGCAIRFIEQQFRTDKIMLEAVKQNGSAIRFIEQKFRTEQIMIEAVKHQKNAIFYIEKKYRTSTIINAFNKNGSVLTK